jgi:hypothetical protein
MQRGLKLEKHNLVRTGAFAFSMDNGRLLIKKRGEDYPCPLTAQATHQLFNLLFDYRHDIIVASKRMQTYGIGRGHNFNKKKHT